MKKFTFLLVVLFTATLVYGQNRQNLQSKIQRMQETWFRISKHSAQFTKSINPLSGDMVLKNAAASETLDSVIYQQYNSETESWVHSLKDEYQYNAEMKNTVFAEKEWNDTTKTWENIGRTEIEYNGNGQVGTMNIYTPDETSGEIKLLNRIEAQYNPSGQLDTVLHYMIDSLENWNIEATQIYQYNETGKLVQMDITSREEDEGEMYIQTMRFVYTYNNAGNLETSAIYFLQEDMEILFTETRYMYDNSGRLTSSEDSVLNIFTFTVEKSSRTEYVYNESGDVSVENTYWWDGESETWMEEFRNQYTYSNLDFSEVVFPSYFHFWGINEEANSAEKAVSEIITTDMIEGSWINKEKTLFYYSGETSTGINDFILSNHSVFPNPATDRVTFRWDTFGPMVLEIYHPAGGRVMKLQVTPGKDVSVSELRPGIYFYKLSNKNQTKFSGKLIKK